MKSARVYEFGKLLVVEDAPALELKPDEVLVRVEACGVCHSDLHMIRGDWPDVAARMSLPAILGHEVVGRVERVGAKVQGVAQGARVGVGWLYSTCEACEFCRDGAENICLHRQVTGVEAPGGFAQFIRMRASHAVPVPESLAAGEAAPLFCAGLTVFHALRNAGFPVGMDAGAAPSGRPSDGRAKEPGQAQGPAPTAQGKRIAVFGIGGLGHLAVQLAAQAGAEVIGVDVSDAKLALARKCGAAEAVNVAAPDAKKLLRANGGPHLAIVTAAAKPAYDLAFRTLRKRGTLAVVGLPKEDLTFFADDWVVGEFRMVGSAVGTRAEMRELLAIAAAGRIRCEVETHGIEAINEVFTRMDRGEILGRAVIKFSD
ncbi:MAG: alcohol dehydrogenase catalytic domain-containing protein [Candidatus Acidiferrales bacterium]